MEVSDKVCVYKPVRKVAEEFETSQWYSILETLLCQPCGDILRMPIISRKTCGEFEPLCFLKGGFRILQSLWVISFPIIASVKAQNQSDLTLELHPLSHGNLNLILLEAFQIHRYKSEFITFPFDLSSNIFYLRVDFSQLPNQPRIET